MREVLPNLFLLRDEQTVAPTPFTFLAIRREGNILFGTKADMSAYRPMIEAKGGVSMILLGDRHHVGPSLAAHALTFGTPLTCSDVEAVPLRKAGYEIGLPLRLERQMLAADIEAIPTPGHTPGAFSYLWQANGDRILFIGDTLVPVDGHWQYWVSKAGREKMVASMRALGDVDFNVIVTNSFACTGNPVVKVKSSERRRILDTVVKALSAA